MGNRSTCGVVNRHWVVASMLFLAPMAQAQDDSDSSTSDFGNRYDSEVDDAEPARAPAEEAKPVATCTPECRPGFDCVDGSCVSQCNPPCASTEICTATRQCIPNPQLQEPVVSEKNLETERIEREERLLGIRGFGGLVVGGGVTLVTNRGANGRLQTPDVEGSFLLALRGGILIRQTELSLEVSPGVFFPIISQGPLNAPEVVDDGNQTSLLANVGYHGHVTDNFYWPLRIGAGLGSVTKRNAGGLRGDIHFQGRLDLFALSMKTKYVLADVTFPSIRYISDFDRFHLWMAMFTVGVSYVSL